MNPCDDRSHFPPPPPALPLCVPAPPTQRWATCDHYHARYRRQNGGGIGLQICTSCRQASYNRLNLQLPPGALGWLRNLHDGTAMNANAQPAVTTIPPWNGFLTRVCLPCEDLILQQIHHRTAVLPPATAPAWTHDPQLDGPQREWQNYPTVSCTCKFRLSRLLVPQAPVLCTEHLEERHAKLITKKTANERWLRNVQKTQGSLAQAKPGTARNRIANGSLRACRVSRYLLLLRRPSMYVY